MGKALIRNLKIEDLQKMATLDNLKKALDIIQGVQEAAESLKENGCTKKQNILKVGTTLTIAFFSKIREGKLPADFEEEDWRDIALHVQEYAVKADETQYSMYVFMLYAAYGNAQNVVTKTVFPQMTYMNPRRILETIKRKDKAR